MITHIVRRRGTPAREMAARARPAGVLLLCALLLHVAVRRAPPDLRSRSARHGYTADAHTVLTEDGYLLTVFHLYGSAKCSGPARHPPVVMMHGFLMSSDTWLDAGPGASLAYLLADACHDLWLGNVRGTGHGRRHARLDPDRDREFWDFSTDEMGRYDVPATIDYVLEATGARRVNYVGYSQGAGALFIMCSERRGHCEKAGVLLALAPGARLLHCRSAGLRLMAKALMIAEKLLSFFGIKEIFGEGDLAREVLSSVCERGTFLDNVCRAVRLLVDSEHAGSVSRETLGEMFRHMPAGTSLRTFARYGQAMGRDRFAKYDFGAEENLRVYGDVAAPHYNLSAVTTPTVVIHGASDRVVDPVDVRWLVSGLPRARALLVEDPEWNHLDFMYSQHNSEFVLPKLLEYLAQYGR